MLLKLQQLKWHPEALSSAAGVMGSSSDSDLSGIFFPGKRRPKKGWVFDVDGALWFSVWTFVMVE